ncbi:MAG TPA: M23 family metallopeptidase [Allosphingosinicella sp.]|nr:M23 family metallopeptidase [Allosphingosinicella sp.]
MSAPATRLLNRGLLVAIVGLAGWAVLTIPTRSPEQAPPSSASAPDAPALSTAPSTPITAPGSALVIPVAGVAPAQLTNTFADARGAGRRHDAIDIMAPRGTPVVAAAEGTVEKLYFSDGGGGISVYVRSPDRNWTYYYAHLDRYAPGLVEGQQVRRGALLGFVGSTGNANADGPHLHFAVNAMSPDERWWQGRPINPYPLLIGRDGAP